MHSISPFLADGYVRPWRRPNSAGFAKLSCILEITRRLAAGTTRRRRAKRTEWMVSVIAFHVLPGSEGRPSQYNRHSPRPLALLALLICTVLTSAASSLHLEQFDHTAWTTRDGAPLNIRGLDQDRDGTLWIFSQSGLYTFDGKSFSIFRSGENDPQLPAQPITSHFMAKNGSLWVGFAISAIAEIRDHRIVRLYDQKDGLPVASVTQILELRDGTVMAIAKDRLFQLTGRRWKDITPDSVLLGEQVRGCFLDRTGTLWMVTLRSIWKKAASDSEFRRTKESGGFVPHFAESPSGVLWVPIQSPGPQPNLLHRLPEDGGETSSRKFPLVTEEMLIDSAGFLWLTGESGVLKLDPEHWPLLDPNLWSKAKAHDSDDQEKLQFDRYDHGDGLTSDSTGAILKDRLGNIWIGGENGLDRFSEARLVRVVDRRISVRTVVTSCPKGNLWTASYGWPVVEFQNGNLVNHGIKREPNFAHCDEDGTLWLSDNTGLYRYGRDGIKHFAPPAGVPAVGVRQVVGKSSHQLFVSYTQNGLWSFVDGRWSRIKAAGFPDSTPVSLLMDTRGRLWAGFPAGQIALLEGSTGRTFRADSATSLGVVQVLLESRFGMLVGGTNNIALLRGDHLQTLPLEDRPAVEGISGLLQAPNGDLWLNGLHGITRIPANEVNEALRSPNYHMRSEHFSEAGIVGPSPQFFAIPSAVVDSHGRFWFSTSNTVVSLDPQSIHPNTTPPILSNISMAVDGSPLQPNHRVDPGYHTFRIGYLGAYLKAPEKVTYQYRLAGADTKWHDVGARSEAVYTGLRPGTYRFSVKASNGEGAWSEADESLQFTVLPSFYQRPAFLLLCLAILAGSLWLAVRLRIRHLGVAIRLREEVRAEERIRIARDLHDTLLQGMQGLTLRFHLVSERLPQKSREREAMESALVLADRLVLEARNSVSHLREEHLQSNNIYGAFEAVAEELDCEKRIRFICEIDEAIENAKPSLLHELYYIGREAMVNAYRHSHASEIRVTLRHLPKALVLSIADNGRGFDPVVQLERCQVGHWGFRGMKERAEGVGARFECSSSSGNGTKIIVTVPSVRSYKG